MTAKTLPLAGLKVLDLTRVLAGPKATMRLADLGAEVWKIENILCGDDTRAWSMPNYKGVSTHDLGASRGEQSLALDLKSPEGRKIVLGVAAWADTLVQNFCAASLDRLGVVYETIRAFSLGSVYCSISGCGQTGPKQTGPEQTGPEQTGPEQTGPERGRPSYDFIMQAESGLMSITGKKDGPPNRPCVALTDVAAGMMATQAILAALCQCRDTGVGQYVDVTRLEWLLNMFINVGTGYLDAEVESVRYQIFDTTDGICALAVANDRLFVDFCDQVISRPVLALDPSFVNSPQRALHRDDLLRIIVEIICYRSRASVPAGRVKTVAESPESPNVTERGVIQRQEHPTLGPMALIRPTHGLAAQLDNIFKIPHALPLRGEYARAVLAGVLGCDSDRTADLIQVGVVSCALGGVSQDLAQADGPHQSKKVSSNGANL